MGWGSIIGGAAGAIGGGIIGGPVGAIAGGSLGGGLGGMLDGDSDNANNEFRDVNQDSFNMPGYDDRQKRLLDSANQMQGRQAPNAAFQGIGRFQMGQGSQIGESDFRQGQGELARMLLAQARGETPSLAMAQAQQQGARNLAAARTMAAGARGPGAALASMQAQRQLGLINAQTSNQGMLGALQERQAAAGMAANAYSTGRAQDIQRGTNQAQLDAAMSQFNAGQYNSRLLNQAQMTQQNRQFNANAQLQQGQMNDQAFLELLRQEQANAQAQQQGGWQYENARTNRFNSLVGVPTTSQQFLAAGAAMAPLAFAQKQGS